MEKMKNPCEECIIRACCNELCDDFILYYYKSRPCSTCPKLTKDGICSSLDHCEIHNKFIIEFYKNEFIRKKARLEKSM